MRGTKEFTLKSALISGLLLTAMGASEYANARECKFMENLGSGSERTQSYATSDGLVVFVADMDVNTDGALRSYKKDDLGFKNSSGKLQTNQALNVICNGVNIYRPDHTKLYGYRQCGKLIKEFKRIRSFGWIKAGENYVNFFGIELRKKVPTPNGKPGYRGYPCERSGYYVSQVARSLPVGHYGDCNPAKWLDAEKIPAIVVPLTSKMKSAGVKLFDLAVVRRLKTGKWIGAVVGDTNPTKIGEVTVNAAVRIKGKANPKNYREVIGLSLGKQAVEYIIFPGSARHIPNLSNSSDGQIQKVASKLFAKHGIGGAQRVCK